jgi:hypothetical protein
MSKKETKETVRTAQGNDASGHLLFGKENYILMLAGVAIIAFGFYLMAGKEDIFSFTKITLAPVVVMIGFIVEVFAIFYKGKKKDGDA